jgi:hypothetical protein
MISRTPYFLLLQLNYHFPNPLFKGYWIYFRVEHLSVVTGNFYVRPVFVILGRKSN